MVKKLKKRCFVRLISFSAFLFATISILAFKGHTLANKYRQDLEYSYFKNLNELSSNVSSIEVSLNKGIYANTKTQQHGLASKLMVQSASAKNALSQLPNSSSENLNNINKFISHVGDFANYLSSKIAKGEKITEEEFNNLKSLGEYAKTVNTQIKDVMAGLDSESSRISFLENNNKNNLVQTTSSIAESFKDINNQFTNYPTLIYDGPFSDHIMNMKSRFLEGKEEVSKEDAAKKVASFLKVDLKTVKYIGESLGNLPTYKFTVNNEEEVSVTKNGGYINCILKNKDVQELKLNYDDAKKIAKDLMSKNNIENMKESYYIIDNGICTINYAYEKENVIYYKDLIKIGIALDTGEIVYFDSTGYLMNHTERNLPKDIITPKKAEESISKKLKIKNRTMAMIPTSGLSEVFCYAFECEGENKDRVLVYINATTGLEEQIYVVIESDNGILVM